MSKENQSQNPNLGKNILKIGDLTEEKIDKMGEEFIENLENGKFVMMRREPWGLSEE